MVGMIRSCGFKRELSGHKRVGGNRRNMPGGHRRLIVKEAKGQRSRGDIPGIPNKHRQFGTLAQFQLAGSQGQFSIAGANGQVRASLRGLAAANRRIGLLDQDALSGYGSIGNNDAKLMEPLFVFGLEVLKEASVSARLPSCGD